MIHNPLSYISIVLVETTHSGNIGSVARAMKTMGLVKLILVNPMTKINHDSVALSSSAHDILETAIIMPDLPSAIQDCHLVIGTSARSRSLDWKQLSPQEIGEKAIHCHSDFQCAIVFGREKSGLTNEELQLCHYHAIIPTQPNYSSLNLAQAVQIIAYEIYKTHQKRHSLDVSHKNQIEYPKKEELSLFYHYLETLLITTQFIQKDNPRHIMAKLKRLFNKASLEKNELNILMGILTTTMKKIK